MDGRRYIAILAVSLPDPSPKNSVVQSRAQHKEAEALIPVTCAKQSSCLCPASAARRAPRPCPAPGAIPRSGGVAGPGTASGPSRELLSEVRGNGAGMGVLNLLSAL